MEILTIMNDTTTYVGTGKLTGAYVSQEVYNKLTLLTLTKGLNKSVLIRKSIMDILDSQDLLEGVAKRMFDLFQKKASPWSDFSPRMFKVYVDKELRSKGLRPYIISSIFKKFDKMVREAK